MFDDVYKGKTVLVTGHTGFKGSWLSTWLLQLGAKVIGYSLEPLTDQDNFCVSNLAGRLDHHIGDIRDFDRVMNLFKKSSPEIVFHLAAQPIVRESYALPKDTFDVNVGGTVNLLECARLVPGVKVFVNITSDKCYENREWAWGYREGDPMGGHDPYSASKGCSELVTNAYYKSFFQAQRDPPRFLSSVRAGNVIGGGDWQKDRLVPDCMRKLERGETIEIRNPDATRPWQHVLEPLSGYLLLGRRMLEQEPGQKMPGQKMPGRKMSGQEMPGRNIPERDLIARGHRYCGAWNFGPEADSIVPVRRVVDAVIEAWGDGKYACPEEADAVHEASLLSLDISKARHNLNWKPRWNLRRTVEATVDWYKNARKEDVYAFNCRQIDKYVSEG